MHYWLVQKAMEGNKGGKQQTLETELNRMDRPQKNRWITSKKSTRSPSMKMILKKVRTGRTTMMTCWISTVSKSMISHKHHPERKSAKAKRVQLRRSLLRWYHPSQARLLKHLVRRGNHLTKANERWQGECSTVDFQSLSRVDQTVTKLMVFHKLKWFRPQNSVNSQEARSSKQQPNCYLQTIPVGHKLHSRLSSEWAHSLGIPKAKLRSSKECKWLVMTLTMLKTFKINSSKIQRVEQNGIILLLLLVKKECCLRNSSRQTKAVS